MPRDDQPLLPPPLGLGGAADPDHGETSYVGSGRLTARRALITGGGSGIGRAVAIAYAREGADIALCYPPEEQADAERTADWVLDAGRRVALLPADLTDEATARGLAQRAVDGLGAVDILVNTAQFPVAHRSLIADVTTAEMDLAVRTQLYALLWVTQGALRHLPRGAAIVNATSTRADEPSGRPPGYASTVAAIATVTADLARELGPRGVRVNAVAPGPIWTPPRGTAPDAVPPEAFGRDTPLGRAGQPAEVAPAFVFLASQRDASYVSGTVLGVTGGGPPG